jgi:hypothetical protein
MKEFYPTAAPVFLMISLLFCCPAAMADGNGREPPAEITLDLLAELYEPVVFAHKSHMEMFGCSSCHHHTAGDAQVNSSCLRCHARSLAVDRMACSGCHKSNWTDQASAGPHTAAPHVYHIDIPRLKGALHLLCLDCHRSQSGPTGCRDCHEFTAAGRKRFAEPDQEK